MDAADPGCDGPAIKSLGSLFKLTQVFLRDGGAQVSSSAERSKSAEVDDNNGLHFVAATEEDMEFTRQMSALGLPLSFHTNKERNGLIKGKRKGTRLMHPRGYHNLSDEALSRVSAEEVVSPANFHDNTSNCLSCISMLGQSESCHCDVAVGVDMSQCASGEGDNSTSYSGVAYGALREQNDDDINEAAIDDAHDGDLLISNIFLSDDLKIASSPPTGASDGSGSNLTGAGVNHCGIENGEKLIDNECLEVSSTICKDTEHETICNDDVDATWQPRAHESDSFPKSSEWIGCNTIADSIDSGELGEWMVCWDSFYMRNYFYNIRTQTSTWHPPPWMEHLAIGGYTEMDDSGAIKATEEHGSQNKTNPLEETLIKEKLAGQPHDECSAEIGFAADNMVSDINVQCEGQSLDHSDALIERSGCNDGVSFCSITDTVEHIISSHERCIKATSEGHGTNLDTVVPVVTGSPTESDPSMKRQELKVKRNRRQRRLYNEAKGQFKEMYEEFSATIGKYWCQRYILFSKFDHGIKMDEEGWFSVTPEPIARHHAFRCASGIIVDCFTGVGGNAIQFAQWCRHVIAIDIDPRKIDYARHNAAIYGVDDRIDFIMGDFFLLAPKFKADTVFLSPPWGGPDYAKVMTYDLKTMLKPHDGYFLFSVAKEIASRVVMFLPRNINLNQLAELSLSACPPWSLEVEKIFLNGKLKAITAYFSDTAVGGC